MDPQCFMVHIVRADGEGARWSDAEEGREQAVSLCERQLLRVGGMSFGKYPRRRRRRREEWSRGLFFGWLWDSPEMERGRIGKSQEE